MALSFFTSSWDKCTEKVSTVNGDTQVATLSCIPTILANIINAMLVLSGVVALFFVIWAGIKYITSRGNPQAVESAKKTLTWAIIGLVFIALSLTVLTIINKIIGTSSFI